MFSWMLSLFLVLATTLVGPRPEAPIPLYLRPAANQPNVGYGVNGDDVTILEQSADVLFESNPDTLWNYVRLERSPYTEGWIQGRFLLKESESPESTDAAAQDTVSP